MPFHPGDRVTIHERYAHSDPEGRNMVGREGTVTGHAGDFIEVNVPDSSPYNDRWLFYANEIEPVASS